MGSNYPYDIYVGTQTLSLFPDYLGILCAIQHLSCPLTMT